MKSKILTRFLNPLLLGLLLTLLLAAPVLADVAVLVPDGVLSAGANWGGVAVANLNDGSDGLGGGDGTSASITGFAESFTVSMSNDLTYSGTTINSVTLWIRADANGTGGGEKLTFGTSQPISDLSANTTIDRAGAANYSHPIGISTSGDVDVMEVDINVGTIGGTEDIIIYDIWVVVDYTPVAGANELNACDSCHTQPPVEGATRNATAGAVVGSHSSHSVYACTVCHPNNAVLTHRGGQGANGTEGQIDMLANIQGGTYSLGSTGFLQDNEDGLGLGDCATVTCHGGITTPKWGDATGLNCDSCHGAPPATGAHATHYSAKGWGATDTSGTYCVQCHPDNAASHSDVTDSTIIVNAGLTYSAVTGSCGNAPAGGCHNGKATPASPGWATFAGIACTDCHTVGGVNTGTSANPVSGLHNMLQAGVQKHDASIAGGCAACHTKANIAGHWDGSNGGDPPNYTDVQAGVSPGVTGGAYTDDGGTAASRGTCATTCHNDGGDWSRQWSTAADSVAVNSGSARCDVCHGQYQAIGGGWRAGTSHGETFSGVASTRGSGHNSLGGAINACEDCHMYTTDGEVGNLYHRDNLMTVNNAGGIDELTNPGTVWCASCHTDDGLYTTSGTHTYQQSTFTLDERSGANDPQGSCFTCHGGGIAGPNQSNYWPDDSNANAENTAGTHVTHMAKIASRLYGEVITNAADNTILMDNTTKNPALLADDKILAICDYCHRASAQDATHRNGTTEVFPVGFKKSLWGAADADATYNVVADTCATVDCHNNQLTLDNTYGWYDLNASNCDTCHTLGGTTNVVSGIIHPNSGLHNITPSVSGATHDDTLHVNGCKYCHTMPIINESGASTHIDGTAVADGVANNDRGLFVDYSDAATGTCSGGTVGVGGCHDGGGETGSWARRWSLTADDGGDAVCVNCHGGLGSNDWTFGGDNVAGDGDVSHGKNWDQAYSSDGTAEVIGNHGGNTNSNDKCNVCHVSPDTGYTGTGLNWGGANNHGNNSIDMNSTYGYTQASWNCSSACHTGAANTDHVLEDSGWGVNLVAGPGLSCTGCHGGGSPAAGVSVNSPHVYLTKADALTGPAAAAACEACHPGGLKGAQHAKSGDANVVVIPNKTKVGGGDIINYSHTVDGAIKGFVLGGDNTIGTTEAQICWNCHDDEATDISEWGTNTGGTYDYGSVTNNDLNWTTTVWSSANFAYKTGPLGTRPVDGNANPGSNAAGRGSASLHATKVAGGWPGSSNSLADVGCSYCHDVHDTGAGTTGAPFLRGNWQISDYLEDGAPQTGDTYTISDYANITDGPPRTNSGENAMGGYQIDQNNGTNHSGYTYAGSDEICANCHDQTTLQNNAPLHKNSVYGFTNDTGVARNIFTNADRSTAVTRQDPGMAYQGVTDYADSKGWMGGFRNELAPGGASAGVAPVVNNQSYGYQAGTFSWGVNVANNSTVQTDFHSFTCAKCHNPHASRLPRLMITNCLDVQRNTWDDTYTGGNWGSWGDLAPSSGEGASELAYSNTAQTCHRFFPAQSGTGSGIYEGKGWNTVTPW